MSQPTVHCQRHEAYRPLCLACQAARDEAAERREAQRAENKAIGAGQNAVPLARIYTVDEMLAQFVFIKDGSQVAPLDRPHAVLALSDFRNALAGSKHWIESDGRQKALSAVKVWLEHPERKEAETLTFQAGGNQITYCPMTGKQALNIWAPIKRARPPADWKKRAQIFQRHIAWLWGEDANPFLDWLAHIEQNPSVLPHYGWVHISREHGKGRNWISAVLARLWPGHVAASLDLVSILDGGFNGSLSRKLLAIVDEINEGGSASYRHAQTLRQIVTAERREINPKYGRKLHEYNSCRWLMFSNHTGALPLTEEDRRFWIVSHQGEPKAPDYYSELYGQLNDPLFIASLAEFLRSRDIAHFKPGQRPPMNQAKAELVAFSQSEEDTTLQEIAARWPVDIITTKEIAFLLGVEGKLSASIRHAIDRAGLRRRQNKVKVRGETQVAYVIRNWARWMDADHAKVVKEIFRVNPRGLPDPEQGS